MNPGQQLRRRFLFALQESDSVMVALLFYRKVPEPAVSVNDTAGLDCLLDEGHQALGRCIRNAAHADAPDPRAIFLYSNDNQGLTLGLPSSNALLFAAVVRLVHLHASGEAVSSRSYHGAPQLMQP